MNNTLQDGTVREIKSSAVNIATASSTTVDVESSVNSVAGNFVSGEKAVEILNLNIIFIYYYEKLFLLLYFRENSSFEET